MPEYQFVQEQVFFTPGQQFALQVFVHDGHFGIELHQRLVWEIVLFYLCLNIGLYAEPGYNKFAKYQKRQMQ